LCKSFLFSLKFFFQKNSFNNLKKAFWDYSEFKFECLLCFCRPAHFAAYDAIREAALKGEDFEIIVSKMRSEAFKTVRIEQENSCSVFLINIFNLFINLNFFSINRSISFGRLSEKTPGRRRSLQRCGGGRAK